ERESDTVCINPAVTSTAHTSARAHTPLTLTCFLFASVDFREDGGDRDGGPPLPKCKESLGVTFQDTCQLCLPRTVDTCVVVLESEVWRLVPPTHTPPHTQLQPRCVLLRQAVLVELLISQPVSSPPDFFPSYSSFSEHYTNRPSVRAFISPLTVNT
ncbi:hypothetical protein AMELA_G00069010, partial [Ameiurus melas]